MEIGSDIHDAFTGSS